MKGTTITMCLAVLALLAVSTPTQSAARELQQAAITDADILNFALNLEYLEAEFYSWAAFGKGLSAEDRGNGSASIGGQKANLTATAQAYAEEIANDEIAHVKFLRSALGAAAVPAPLIDIGKAFSAAADAAANTTLTPPFNPYANDVFFYHGAFIFEDVGVTAYKGAAPLIANKDYLGAAAGILAVEAYHAGTVRTLLYQIRNATAYGLPVSGIVGAISNLRDAVNPSVDVDQGILTATGGANIVPVDKNSIAFSRTPAQVLNIVYLGGPKPGGFFPNGLNGNIK